MNEHHDTGTGWPELPAAPPPEAPAPAEPVPATPAEPAQEWDVDGPDTAAEPAVEASPPAGRRGVSAAGAVIGLLLVLFGFAFVVQLRSHATDTSQTTARPEDLVRILSDLDARKDRLSQEISQLQTTQQQLAAGSQGRQAALDAAAKRARDLGILAGTLPAQGPGIQVQFLPGGQGLKAAVILDAVQELRDAGAEALELDGGNGTAVRVVASSWFVDAPGGLQVDGQTLTGQY